MRKISYIGLAIAAVAITGCAKTDLSSIETAPSERSIDFGGYLSRPTNSKAEGIVDVDAFKKDGTFKAWAFVTQDVTGHDAPLSTAVAIKAHSTLDGESDFAWVEGAGAPIIPQWKSGDTKHLWQDVGLGLTSFYAISSKQATLTFKAPVAGSAPVSASFDYTVGTIENDTETAEDNQEDLIAAHKLDLSYDISETSPGQVNFDFAHLLTQVRFTVKASAADFKLKVLDIRLVDVASGGTFNFDPTGATIGTWAVDKASAKVTYNYFNALADKGQHAAFPTGFPTTTVDPETNFISTTAVDLPLFGGAKATDCMMLLPSVAMDGANAIGLKGVKLSVTYQCYIWNGEDLDTDVDNWVTDGGAITRVIEFTEAEKWEMNKRISYNLTLFNSDSGKIIYDPTTSNWTDESSDSNLKPEEDVIVPPVVTP